VTVLVQVYKNGSPVAVRANQVHEYLAMPGWSAEPPGAKPPPAEGAKSAPSAPSPSAPSPSATADSDLFSTDPPAEDGSP
jgi:hypothetical protein